MKRLLSLFTLLVIVFLSVQAQPVSEYSYKLDNVPGAIYGYSRIMLH